MADSKPGTKYRVLVGMNYPDGHDGEKRAEVDDIVSDLPKDSIKSLLEQGAIEPADKKSDGGEG